MRRSGRAAKVTGPENRREARKGPPGVEFPPPPPNDLPGHYEDLIKCLESANRNGLGCKCVTHVIQFVTEVKGAQARMNHDARAVT